MKYIFLVFLVAGCATKDDKLVEKYTGIPDFHIIKCGDSGEQCWRTAAQICGLGMYRVIRGPYYHGYKRMVVHLRCLDDPYRNAEKVYVKPSEYANPKSYYYIND